MDIASLLNPERDPIEKTPPPIQTKTKAGPVDGPVLPRIPELQRGCDLLTEFPSTTETQRNPELSIPSREQEISAPVSESIHQLPPHNNSAAANSCTFQPSTVAIGGYSLPKIDQTPLASSYARLLRDAVEKEIKSHDETKALLKRTQVSDFSYKDEILANYMLG
jgi:hypothetical protein